MAVDEQLVLDEQQQGLSVHHQGGGVEGGMWEGGSASSCCPLM